MAEEVTLGELGRRLADLQEQTRRDQAEQDARLAALAAGMIPVGEYQADRARVHDRINDHLKQSDERYALLQKSIEELGTEITSMRAESKERAKRIANNRTVVGMALFTGFLLPILVLIMQHAFGL